MDKHNLDITPGNASKLDSTTHTSFYDYYAEKSLSPKTLERFSSIQRLLLYHLGKERSAQTLNVADVGCGAGAQCKLWSQGGHNIYGLDINQPLLELGLRRSKEDGLNITFAVGSATNLPWSDQSMDVCLVPELLEHVEDWKSCLNEFVRILRPGGILFLSTSNKLCPIQEEFDLPLYSWYPKPLKHHYEHLARTTRPELANHAKYPAIHWFTFYQLRDELNARGMHTIDRFDAMNPEEKSPAARAALSIIHFMPPIRWLAHVATPYVDLLAFKG